MFENPKNSQSWSNFFLRESSLVNLFSEFVQSLINPLEQVLINPTNPWTMQKNMVRFQSIYPIGLGLLVLFSEF